MVNVSVKNLGPIASADVGLKPLTVFVGPSNTGKSIMAMAIHAVMKASGPEHSRGDRSFWYRRHRPMPPEHSRGVRNFWYRRHRPMTGEAEIVLGALRDWVVESVNDESTQQELTISVFPETVRLEVKQSTERFLSQLQQDIIEQLGQTYGESQGFVRRHREPRDFGLALSCSDPILNMEVGIDGLGLMPTFDVSQAKVDPSVNELKRLLPRRLIGTSVASEIDDDFLRYFLVELLDSAAKYLLGGWSRHSFYLPAGRLGITQGHKVIAGTLVRQAPYAGVRAMEIPTLPSISAEFMSNLLTLDPREGYQTLPDDFKKAISFIEHQVLQGNVELEESSGFPVPNIIYEPTGSEPPLGKFHFHQTSSMVSELAPVILFLKYLVSPDDLLIFEEPESHLHPAAQRQMARGIVRLVNAGVKVLVTTHSDIFISQINNLLRLRHTDDSWLRKQEFQPEDCLDPDQVVAYLFRYDEAQDGSVTYPLEIDPDTGIDQEEFAAVFEAIYDESIALQRDHG